MSKTAYLVHGFNVRDGGRGTIDMMIPYFERCGWTVRQVDYDWTGLLGVRLCTKKIAKALSTTIQPGSVAVGHSNGCAVLHYAAQYGAPFSRLAYINPALNKDAPLADQVEACHVWHSPSDRPVSLARWLPFHFWGEMGAKGYVGEDKRYVNHNKERDFPIRSYTHSDIFYLAKMAFFAPKIIQDLEPENGE